MMTQLWNSILNLQVWGDSRGQDLVEYALAAGLIAGIAVALSPTIGGSIVNVFSVVVAQLQVTGGGAAAPSM